MIRRTVPTVPLALVDGIRNVSTMDAILDCNLADLISMSKPLINEPDLPNKLKEGQPESNCIDCRECVSKERFGQMMLSCAQLEK